MVGATGSDGDGVFGTREADCQTTIGHVAAFELLRTLMKDARRGSIR